MAFPFPAASFSEEKIVPQGDRQVVELKCFVLKVAVELLGVVLTEEEGAAQAAVTLLTEGEDGLARADGASQERTAFTRTGVGWAAFFLFSAVVKIPAVHGSAPEET